MRLIALVTALLALTVPPVAAAGADSDEWQFTATPYLWLPRIDGELKYALPPGGGGSPDVSVGPTDWLDLLNYGLLAGGSARKGRALLMSDLMYLSMTSKNDGAIDSVRPGGGGNVIPVSGSLNTNTRTDLDALVLTLAAGYSLGNSRSSSLDAFVGLRYFGVDVDTSWTLTAEITGPGGGTELPIQGGRSADTDIWDFIVGFRGQTAVGQNWSIPYHLDFGTGDSDLTWNLYIGANRAFGWGELLFAYRHMEYDQGSSALVNEFSFTGPAVGARFSF